MGYTTSFNGQLNVEPPLNEAEIKFLTAFANSRRMHRSKGPYFVEGEGFKGQNKATDIINYNSPDPSQFGLWCHWVPTKNGDAIEWDGGEKFYHADDWLLYIIDHFLKPRALAKKKLPFLQANHICNGTIDAQGEDIDDRWRMVVVDNVLTVQRGTITYA